MVGVRDRLARVRWTRVTPIWATSVRASVLTTLVLSLTVGPRLTARAIRVRDLHVVRAHFNDWLLEILAMCANLHGTEVGARFAPIRRERQRWISQLDQSTEWLVDNWHRFGLGFPQWQGVSRLSRQFAFVARGLWLSLTRA